jgi:hypothetical protein
MITTGPSCMGFLELCCTLLLLGRFCNLLLRACRCLYCCRLLNL